MENCIVSYGLPLSIVDNDHFKKFVHDLDSKFTVPSRDSIMSMHLPWLLLKVEEKVRQTAEEAACLSLTVDIATDHRNNAFLAITGQMFMKPMSQTFLLAFESFNGHIHVQGFLKK
jgi:hypothetical protein